MSYCWFNRKKLLKNAWDIYHNKGGKQKAAKYYTTNQELLREVSIEKISIEICQKRKKIKKWKYQRERYPMNADLNERLKQYQRNYYASKKIKK